MEDRNGNYLTYSYDANDRLIAISPNGTDDSRQLEFEYYTSGDFSGFLNRVTDADGIPYVTYAYSTVTASHALWSETFSALTTVTHREDAEVSYAYTSFNYDTYAHHRLRMDQVINALGEIEADYDYEAGSLAAYHPRANYLNADGDVLLDYISSTDGQYEHIYDVYRSDEGYRTTSTSAWSRNLLRVHDGEGYNVSITYVGSQNTDDYEPTSQDLPSLVTNASGVTTTHTYDNTFSHGDWPDYSYDDPYDHFRHASQLEIETSEGDTATWAYSSDDYALITSRVDRLGWYSEYGYDSYGNLTQVTYPDGLQTTYAYDGYGQVTSQVSRMGHYSTAAYNDWGLVTSTGDHLGRHHASNTTRMALRPRSPMCWAMTP